jgi:hypothetical protein
LAFLRNFKISGQNISVNSKIQNGVCGGTLKTSKALLTILPFWGFEPGTLGFQVDIGMNKANEVGSLSAIWGQETTLYNQNFEIWDSCHTGSELEREN